MDYGVLLASVTANGKNWTSDEAPFYTMVAAGVNSPSAGYDMKTGQFAPGGMDMVSSKAGQSGRACDADVGAVWFPFSEGKDSTASFCCPQKECGSNRPKEREHRRRVDEGKTRKW